MNSALLEAIRVTLNVSKERRMSNDWIHADGKNIFNDLLLINKMQIK